MSYNCRGLKLGTTRYYERLDIKQLLDEYDRVCLQETWLSKQKEEVLKCMRMDCNAVSNSPNDDSLCITAGRKREGVGILWKKHLDKFITPHTYDYDWVVSIEITTGGERYIYLMYIFPTIKRIMRRNILIG